MSMPFRFYPNNLPTIILTQALCFISKVLFSYRFLKLPEPQGINRGAAKLGLAKQKGKRRKGSKMLEWLKNILGDGYTEDIDKRVSSEIGKAFVSKADFNVANENYKQLMKTAQKDKLALDNLGDTPTQIANLTA